MTKVSELIFQGLPYAYNALEPHIDAMTMEIHHSRHHKAYFDNLQAAVKDTDMAGMEFTELLRNISKFPVAVRNNGGGHYNHELFWNIMSAQGGGEPQGELASAIARDFGSFADFREKFSNAAKTRFGSGWAWLCVLPGGKLEVCSTPNQDNPLMDVSECKGQPILGLDVWEHAYYLKYQNKRPDYVSAFWNLVDWNRVGSNFKQAI
jgi:Fe-Mn family superoxide dismutase